MNRLALVDLDGVLADDRHRIQYAIDKDWDEYFLPERILADDPWPEGQEMVARLVAEGFVVQYLTGRWSSLRTVTEEWLDRNGFPMRRLTMREPLWHPQNLSEHGGWPSMRLGEFKVDYIARMRQSGGYDAIHMYDDDPNVIEAVQAHFGSESGTLCTWSIKPTEVVVQGQA